MIPISYIAFEIKNNRIQCTETCVVGFFIFKSEQFVFLNLEMGSSMNTRHDLVLY